MELSGISLPVMRWDDSNLAEAWDKFQRHVGFIFSGPLKSKKEEEKISYLLLWVGEKGRNIHATGTLTEEESKKLDTYYAKFKTQAQPKLNPIFARFKFNNQLQDSDTIDHFVTRLRLIVKDCHFVDGDSKIRDRIVFGTNSQQIREKLINEGSSLTLDKAIQIAQSLEYSREQLKVMQQASGSEISYVSSNKFNGQPKRQNATGSASAAGAASNSKSTNKGHSKTSNRNKISCGNCGQKHELKKCPAYGRTCNKCKKMQNNNWYKTRSGRVVRSNQYYSSSEWV